LRDYLIFSMLQLLKILGLVCLSLILLCATVSAQSYWVKDPNNCPTSYQSQTCSGSDVVCGYDSGITYCYDPASISAPGGSTTSNTNRVCEDSCDGGYVIDCYDYDGSAPHCDNSGSAWCDRNSTCYTTWHRITSCTGGSFGASTCGSCNSGYRECDGGNDECEVVDNAACESNSHFDADDACVGSYGACDCDSGYDDCNNDDGDANQETGQYGSDGCEIDEYTTDYPTGGNNRYNNNCACICDSNYEDCDASGCDAGNGCEYQALVSCGTNALNQTGCAGCTCNSGYYFCDGAPDDGDGCEINDGSSCSVGAVSGTWDCSVGAGGCYTVDGGTEYSCTCEVDPQDIATTGSIVLWSGTYPMLWMTQYGSGASIYTNFSDGSFFEVNSTGAFWNNSDLSAGVGDGAFNASYEYWTNQSLTNTFNATYDAYTDTAFNSSYEYWTNQSLTNTFNATYDANIDTDTWNTTTEMRAALNFSHILFGVVYSWDWSNITITTDQISNFTTFNATYDANIDTDTWNTTTEMQAAINNSHILLDYLFVHNHNLSVGGGSGSSKWVDGGSYIYPNSTYANDARVDDFRSNFSDIYQKADNKGLEIFGYDDKSSDYLKLYLNSQGNGFILADEDLSISAIDALIFTTLFDNTSFSTDRVTMDGDLYVSGGLFVDGSLLEDSWNTTAEMQAAINDSHIKLDWLNTTTLYVNDSQVQFVSVNDTMMFWAERGSVTINSYWALGNGQLGKGLPIPSDGFTAGNFFIACQNAVGTTMTVKLYKNQTDTGCSVTYNAPLSKSNATYCGVDLTEGDQVGCYVTVETGTFTNCVCSLELEKNLGSIAAIKGDKGDTGPIDTNEVSTTNGQFVIWNGTGADTISQHPNWRYNVSDGANIFGQGYTYFDDYVLFDSEPFFYDGIRIYNYANFYDNADYHNMDLENVATIYSTYVDTTYLTYSSSDPEVLTFYPTTRNRVIDLIETSTPPDKWGGLSFYYNDETDQLEAIDQKTGNILKPQFEVIGNVGKLDSRAKYYDGFRYDPTADEIKSFQYLIPFNELPEGFDLNRTTGVLEPKNLSVFA
jgi:hypothetical protein